MKKLCVIGSLNVDLTVRLSRFHRPGETVIAKGVANYPGGKGGNQAVALSKLGKDVLMVGMLGDDESGRFYRKVLSENGVDTSLIGAAGDMPSGTAVIEVDEAGENRIAIFPGTNRLVDVAYIQKAMETMLARDIFLMQFEIPLDGVLFAARSLKDRGKTVILDPAPAAPVSQELYASVDYLTPNGSELAALSGMPTETDDQVFSAARVLIRRGARAVIAKRGERGCLYVDAKTALKVPGYPVKVVDTTAAGDSFNAGFAAALADEMPLAKALEFSNAVGALSTTGAGAQSSMPTMEQVVNFLAVHNG